MDIREAIPDDAPAVRRVARRSWHETYDEIIGEEAVDEMIDEWYDVGALKKSIERPENPMFVAISADLVGFVQGGPSEDGPADAVLSRIYIAPANWGDGVGTTLLERLCTALRTDGHDSVWLSVIAHNDVGRAFYAKHAFEMHERRTAELAGQDVTELILVKDL